MDPTLFALRWEQLFEALIALVLLSILLERSLSLVFENAAFINAMKDSKSGVKSYLREAIAFVAAAAICWYWKFDLPAIMLTSSQTSWPGYLITGGVIAGGSKGSIRLFRDILQFKSGALKEYEEDKAKARGSQSTNVAK